MNAPDNILGGDASEGAAYGLVALMSGLSEEFYAATWLSSLEYMLWRIKPGEPFGMGTITERQATLLRLLSDECDGWWRWNHAAGEPEFVRRSDWLTALGDQP